MQNIPDGASINKPVDNLSMMPPVIDTEFYLNEIRNREKFILEMGGSPVKLLKRKWVGEQCPVCFSETREQARADCTTCYGVGIVGGYYPDIQILVSFVNPATQKIEMYEQGLKRTITPRTWTIHLPKLDNKDILVNKQNQRFWVNNVTPTMWRGEVLHQSMDVEIVEPSHIIYRIPIGDFVI